MRQDAHLRSPSVVTRPLQHGNQMRDDLRTENGQVPRFVGLWSEPVQQKPRSPCPPKSRTFQRVQTLLERRRHRLSQRKYSEGLRQEELQFLDSSRAEECKTSTSKRSDSREAQYSIKRARPEDPISVG